MDLTERIEQEGDYTKRSKKLGIDCIAVITILQLLPSDDSSYPITRNFYKYLVLVSKGVFRYPSVKKYRKHSTRHAPLSENRRKPLCQNLTDYVKTRKVVDPLHCCDKQSRVLLALYNQKQGLCLYYESIKNTILIHFINFGNSGYLALQHITIKLYLPVQSQLYKSPLFKFHLQFSISNYLNSALNPPQKCVFTLFNNCKIN